MRLCRVAGPTPRAAAVGERWCDQVSPRRPIGRLSQSSESAPVLASRYHKAPAALCQIIKGRTLVTCPPEGSA